MKQEDNSGGDNNNFTNAIATAIIVPVLALFLCVPWVIVMSFVHNRYGAEVASTVGTIVGILLITALILFFLGVYISDKNKDGE